MKEASDESFQGGITDVKLFNTENPSSSDYVKATSYQIGIGELYKFVDHNAQNQANNLCSVILKARKRELQKEIGAQNKYILKVWNKEGKNLYQRYLTEQPEVCELYQNVLIYVCQSKAQLATCPEDEQVITLVHFNISGVTTEHKLCIDPKKLDLGQVRNITYLDKHLILYTASASKQSFYSIKCHDFIEKAHPEPTMTKESVTPQLLFDFSESFPVTENEF